MRMPVIALGLVMSSTWAVESTVADSTAFFRERIRPVLVENCWRCHGPARQRGGLRLDSRAAVLQGGRTSVVEPGHPELSALIDAISYDNPDLQMPPAGMLGAQERTDLATWIAIGVPWAEASTPIVADPVPATRTGSWWTWFGHWHPVVVHFPVALLIAAALAELVRLVRSAMPGDHAEHHRRTTTRFCLLLAAPASVVAAVLGWSAGTAVITSTTLDLHRWLGVTVAALAMLALWLLPVRVVPVLRQRFGLALLLLSALLVGVVGHLGGTLVHGADWFTTPAIP